MSYTTTLDLSRSTTMISPEQKADIMEWSDLKEQLQKDFLSSAGDPLGRMYAAQAACLDSFIELIKNAIDKEIPATTMIISTTVDPSGNVEVRVNDNGSPFPEKLRGITVKPPEKLMQFAQADQDSGETVFATRDTMKHLELGIETKSERTRSDESVNGAGRALGQLATGLSAFGGSVSLSGDTHPIMTITTPSALLTTPSEYREKLMDASKIPTREEDTPTAVSSLTVTPPPPSSPFYNFHTTGGEEAAPAPIKPLSFSARRGARPGLTLGK